MQGIIASQENEIIDLKKEVAKFSKTNSNEKEKSFKTDTGEEAELMQNTPNPFTNNAEIKYYIPVGIKEASIIITNLNGIEKVKYKITGTGTGSITVTSRGLDAGIYLYSLIADGNIVDTKKMLISSK